MAYILTRDQCSHNAHNGLDLSTVGRNPVGGKMLIREAAELLAAFSALKCPLRQKRWCVRIKYTLRLFTCLQQFIFSGSFMKDSSTTHQICSIMKSSTGGNVRFSEIVAFGRTEGWSILQDVVSGSPQRTDDPRVQPLRAGGKMQQVSPGDSVVLQGLPSLYH